MDKNELSLPPAKNPAAEVAADRMESSLAPLPTYVDRQGFAVACMVELNKIKGGKVRKPNSAVVAVFNAASVGLPPGGANAFCYFVPRGGEVRFEMGYRGFLELAYGCQFLRDVSVDVILKSEMGAFRYGTDRNGDWVDHDKTDRLVGDESRRVVKPNVVGAYCLWSGQKGGHGITVLTRDQLDAIERRAATYDDSPWNDPHAYCEMAKKSPLKNAAKKWPRLSDQMAKAVLLDDLYELGRPQDHDAPKSSGTPVSLAGESDGEADGSEPEIDTEE